MALNTYVDLEHIPRTHSRVVIINCGTKWLSLLAILSAHRYIGLPILLIDCESKDGSKALINSITDTLSVEVDCVDWPLRPHPIALDHVFARIPSDRVLLMDSDLELRSAAPFRLMHDALDIDSEAYGSGPLHGPMWIGEEHGIPPHTGYYAQRMWIPFTYLRTRDMRSAMQSGDSFVNRRVHYEVAGAPALSRVLARRYRVAGLKHIPIPWMGRRRPVIDGATPKFIEYDTGADLHAHLIAQGKRFWALPVAYWGDVTHYHGVTRAGLATGMRRIAKKLHLISRKTETDEATVVNDVLRRLASEYGVPVERHA